MCSCFKVTVCVQLFLSSCLCAASLRETGCDQLLLKRLLDLQFICGCLWAAVCKEYLLFNMSTVSIFSWKHLTSPKFSEKLYDCYMKQGNGKHSSKSNNLRMAAELSYAEIVSTQEANERWIQAGLRLSQVRES